MRKLCIPKAVKVGGLKTPAATTVRHSFIDH